MKPITALCVTLAACSSVEVREVDQGAGGGTSTSVGATGGAAPVEGCQTADGVRVCGGIEDQCPWLEAPACPGHGCTPALDRSTLEPSPAGLCWADERDQARDLCTVCKEGEVCALRDDDQLVCVSRATCDALFALGATNVCRWSDKSAYAPAPIPEPPFCPTNDGSLCGGPCGPCAPSIHGEVRCTGRSPLHPLGVCAAFKGAGLGSSCSLGPTGQLTTSCGPAGYCAIFDVLPSDQPWADRYGICIKESACVEAAKVLGTLRCFDDEGQVAP